jgi:hypothetical protein
VFVPRERQLKAGYSQDWLPHNLCRQFTLGKVSGIELKHAPPTPAPATGRNKPLNRLMAIREKPTTAALYAINSASRDTTSPRKAAESVSWRGML